MSSPQRGKSASPRPGLDGHQLSSTCGRRLAWYSSERMCVVAQGEAVAALPTFSPWQYHQGVPPSWVGFHPLANDVEMCTILRWSQSEGSCRSLKVQFSRRRVTSQQTRCALQQHTKTLEISFEWLSLIASILLAAMNAFSYRNTRWHTALPRQRTRRRQIAHSAPSNIVFGHSDVRQHLALESLRMLLSAKLRFL